MERLELEKQNDTTSMSMLATARRVRHLYFAILINPLYVAGLIGNLMALLVFALMLRGRIVKKGTISDNGDVVRRHRYARHGRQALGLLMAVSLSDASYLAFMLEYTGSSWGLPFLELRSNLACALLFYLRGVAGTSAILLFTALSCNRLMTLNRGPIARSGSTWRRLPKCIRSNDYAAVWASIISVALALIVTFPRLLSFRLHETGGSVPCRSEHGSRLSTILHMSAHMVFQRLGPPMIISILNLLILVRLHQNRKLATTESASLDAGATSQNLLWRHYRRHIRLTKACLVLGCSYVIFFLPPGIYWCFIYSWDIDKYMSPARLHFHATVGDMAAVTSTLSSAINLPVYLACLTDFRAAARDLLLPRTSVSSPRTSDVSETGLELHTVTEQPANGHRHPKTGPASCDQTAR